MGWPTLNTSSLHHLDSPLKIHTPPPTFNSYQTQTHVPRQGSVEQLFLLSLYLLRQTSAPGLVNGFCKSRLLGIMSFYIITQPSS